MGEKLGEGSERRIDRLCQAPSRSLGCAVPSQKYLITKLHSFMNRRFGKSKPLCSAPKPGQAGASWLCSEPYGSCMNPWQLVKIKP